jgi:hypothetical protein
MDDSVQILTERIERLENLMAEHRHSSADGTLPLPERAARIQRVVTGTIITPKNTDKLVDVSALASNTTIANPAGTFTDAQLLRIRLKDNSGGPWSIAYGTMYQAGSRALVTQTVAGKFLEMGFEYHKASNKLRQIALDQEA